jgi:NADH-quinone oxidoreductase subunit L
MALYWLGVGTAVLTSFYMFRLYFRTFGGESRAPADVRGHIEEQSNWMVGPLVVLAVLAVVGGYVGLPDMYGEWALGIEESNSLHYFLQSVAPSAAHDVTHATELGLVAVAVGAALIGVLLAWWLYLRQPELPDRIAQAIRPVYGVVFHKFFVDEIYDALIVRPLVRLSDAFLHRTVDARWIDGAGVNGTAAFVRGVADRGLKYAQTGLTQSYLFVMLIGSLLLVGYLLGRA